MNKYALESTRMICHRGLEAEVWFDGDEMCLFAYHSRDNRGILVDAMSVEALVAEYAEAVDNVLDDRWGPPLTVEQIEGDAATGGSEQAEIAAVS